MKKYTYYKASLFIGLLAFSTLTSCVNKRQELGISLKSLHPSNWKCLPFGFTRWAGNNPKKSALACGTAIMGTLFVTTGGLLYGLNQPLYQGVCKISESAPIAAFRNNVALATPHNGKVTNHPTTVSTVSTTLRPDIDAITEKATKAIQDGEKEWGSTQPTTMSISSTSSHPDRDTTTGTVTEAPEAGEQEGFHEVNFTIKRSNLLSDQTIEDLKQTSYRKDFIKCLIDNGQSKDAIDKNGFTMLHHAIIDGNKDASESLIDDYNANCNIASKAGTFPLFIAMLKKLR